MPEGVRPFVKNAWNTLVQLLAISTMVNGGGGGGGKTSIVPFTKKHILHLVWVYFNDVDYFSEGGNYSISQELGTNGNFFLGGGAQKFVVFVKNNNLFVPIIQIKLSKL